MANLTDSDRGQIILVAAFALGVIFIALAVVINTAIFTENLATRGAGTSDDDALQYRHEVDQSVGTIITEINEQYDGDNTTDLQNWAEANVTEISIQGGRQKAATGRVVSVDFHSVENGTKFENTSGSFENSSGNSTWTVAENINRTRALEITVTNTSKLADNKTDAFNLSVQNGPDKWNLTVFNDSDTEPVNIMVTNGSGNVANCTRSVSDQFTISVSTGLVAGEPCPALQISQGQTMWFGTGVPSSYSIVFDNASNIEGEYRGIIDKGGSVTQSSDSSKAIYSLMVSYSYETVSMRYETNVRVAPEEPAS